MFHVLKLQLVSLSQEVLGSVLTSPGRRQLLFFRTLRFPFQSGSDRGFPLLSLRKSSDARVVSPVRGPLFFDRGRVLRLNKKHTSSGPGTNGLGGV